jgi:transposase-like protein
LAPFQGYTPIAAGKSPAAAAREHGVHPTMISQWRRMHAQYGEAAFAGNGNTYKDEALIAELH